MAAAVNSSRGLFMLVFLGSMVVGAFYCSLDLQRCAEGVTQLSKVRAMSDQAVRDKISINRGNCAMSLKLPGGRSKLDSDWGT